MKKIKEKRKAPRLNVHHLVKYRLIDAPDKKLTLASIKDISAVGARMFVNEKLPVTSQIQVYIIFPWLNDAVPILAKIAWVNRQGWRKKFECGLEFIDLDDKIRKDIHERITNAH